MSFLTSLGWWVYVLVAIAIFCTILLVNYIVKKVNEARLEDRLLRLYNKSSMSRYSQVQRQPLEMPPLTMLESIVEQSNPPTIQNTLPTENRNSKDLIQIMNFPDSKNIYTPNTQEVNGNKINSSRTLSSQPIKSTFLGIIYKDSQKLIKKSKSYSNADKNIILDEIVDKAKKINESKSTSNIHGLTDYKNKADLKIWSVELLAKKFIDITTVSDDKMTPVATTSQYLH